MEELRNVERIGGRKADGHTVGRNFAAEGKTKCLGSGQVPNSGETIGRNITGKTRLN
jgi:hypothetical protein